MHHRDSAVALKSVVWLKLHSLSLRMIPSSVLVEVVDIINQSLIVGRKYVRSPSSRSEGHLNDFTGPVLEIDEPSVAANVLS